MHVVDHVVEAMIMGLETNETKHSQKRIGTLQKLPRGFGLTLSTAFCLHAAEVRFLAELYNYSVLNHHAVFAILYTLINWGHAIANPIQFKHARLVARTKQQLMDRFSAAQAAGNERLMQEINEAFAGVNELQPDSRAIETAERAFAQADPSQGSYGFHPLVPCAMVRVLKPLRSCSGGRCTFMWASDSDNRVSD